MKIAEEMSVSQIKKRTAAVIGVLAAAVLLSGAGAFLEPAPAAAEVTTESEAAFRENIPVTGIPIGDMAELYMDFAQPEDRRLILVNRVIPMPADREPELTEIGGEKVSSDMAEDLSKMLRDAAGAGANIKISSGYRNEIIQETLLNIDIRKKIKRGMSEYEACAEALDRFEAPGHSDHHTGYAVDFSREGVVFERTYEYKWLSENSWRYGFVERYPEGKETVTGLSHCPGHFRYVGRKNAENMKEQGFCLEEYILWLKKAAEKGIKQG